MAKVKYFYHDGLTKGSLKVITVYRLTIVYSFTSLIYTGETHHHYFEKNDALLQSYLMEAVVDMSKIEEVKLKKI